MKILHLANWNSTNIGNGALIHGTERLVTEDFRQPVEFIAEPWDDFTFKRKKFDEAFVDEINSSCDMFVVNGAVTLNAFRKKMHNTGMRFDLPLHLWKKIKVPIVFYGISYRCWPFQMYPNKEALRSAIEFSINSDNIFFGVRNDGTKEWIAREIGIESDDIVEVPDPGLFVPYEENDHYPEIVSDKKSVIIALNGEDAEFRYATEIQKSIWKTANHFIEDRILKKAFSITGGYKRRRKDLCKKIAKAIEKLADKYQDVQFIIVPHYLDDYGMIQDFIEVIQERIAHQLIISTGLLRVPETAYFYGRYKHADLALSMRVHSMSPSIGMGVPVIPITSQGRMRLFLEKMGLAGIAADVKSESFTDDLFNKAVDLLDDPDAFKRTVEPKVRKAREEVREVNKKIEAMILK